MTDYSKFSDEELYKKYNDTKKEIAKYHNKQMSIKILMNALYGAVSNVYFLYYILDMAESITKSGQLSIKWVSLYLNNYMNRTLGTENFDYITYIDTDSVYLNLEPLIVKLYGTTDIDKDVGENIINKISKAKIEGVIKEAYDILAKTLNVYENKMSMKQEKINDHAIFTGKKRYILNTLNKEGVHYDTPKISVTGLESVRSSTPEICRDKLKEAFKIFLTGTEKELQDFISEFKEQFLSLPVEDIAKNTGTDIIEKFMHNGSYIKGTPSHVRGAIVFNDYLKKMKLDKKYNVIISGDKVKVVYLKMPNPVHENIISFNGILPKELGLDKYIDYELQFEKVFLSPLKTLSAILKWDCEKIENIMDIFE